MIKDLIKLANHLDDKGFTKEADTLDNIIKKLSPNKSKKNNIISQEFESALDSFCKLNEESFRSFEKISEELGKLGIKISKDYEGEHTKVNFEYEKTGESISREDIKQHYPNVEECLAKGLDVSENFSFRELIDTGHIHFDDF